MRRTNSPTASKSRAPTNIFAPSIPRWSASLLSWRNSPHRHDEKAEQYRPAPPFLLRDPPRREAPILARKIETQFVARRIAQPRFPPAPAFVFRTAVEHDTFGFQICDP